MPNLSLSVIPVKTGIQCFQYVLDTREGGYPVLSIPLKAGWMLDQVRHD